MESIRYFNGKQIHNSIEKLKQLCKNFTEND